MDLTPYVDALRRELMLAAEAGDPAARELAERLTAPLESAVRLTLLEALSAAAGEITRELAPGSVDLRLRGRDPTFLVTPAPAGRSPEEAPKSSLRSALAGAVEVAMGVRAPLAETDEGGMARISLRVPDHLKARVEEAAGLEGLSINAWLVRAASAALEPGSHGSDRRRTGWMR